MSAYLPPIVWCMPTPSDAPSETTTITEPPTVTINTVGDYIEAHSLDLMLANPGLRELAIGTVKVEHDSVVQLTYFIGQDGTLIGTASWPAPEDGPEVYAGRGQQVQSDRRA